MRTLVLVAILSACESKETRPAREVPNAATATATSSPAATPTTASKPPDEMDERMRHCPVALDGATSELEDIDGGVRFTVKPPAEAIDEARRRARHIVEFAAKRTRAGHGEFDGKGGGRMRNCPVVTDDVTITAVDVDGGVRLDVLAADGAVDRLRQLTRARTSAFPFVGATIRVAGTP